FVANGDAQASLYVLRRTTFNATPSELLADNAVSRMIMPLNSVWAFNVQVVASGTNQSTHVLQAAGYEIKGVIRCAPNGVTTLLGTPTTTILYEDDPAWDVTALGDGGGGGSFKLGILGGAQAIINWVASVRTVEVIK